MRRRLLGVVAAAFVLIAPAAPAGAGTLRAKYQHRYHAVAKQFGGRARARNIVTRGAREGRPAIARQRARAARALRRWGAPAAAAIGRGDRAPRRYATAAYKTGGAYALPRAIVMCESGGNY